MNIHGISFYSEQIVQLRAEVETQRAGLAPEETESIAATRLNQAATFLAEADFHIEEVKRGHRAAAVELHRTIISCQVELDYFHNPDVDPFVGWIRTSAEKRSDGRRYTIVDSQLYRVFVDEGTSTPVSFQYKPRKLDLMSGVWVDGGVLSVNQTTFEVSSKNPLTDTEAERLIRRNGFDTAAINPKVNAKIKTKDLVRLCLSSDLGNGQIRECRDMVFKAGVGAHLANATSGFSIEHWLESKKDLSTHMTCLQLNLTLPTKDVKLISVRPLTAFGGVGEKVRQFDPNVFVRSVDEPAGVHGGRLIDGLGSLVIDVRSAKPLNAINIVADQDEGLVVGLIMQLFVDARRVLGDDKANTVFISIT